MSWYGRVMMEDFERRRRAREILAAYRRGEITASQAASKWSAYRKHTAVIQERR